LRPIKLATGASGGLIPGHFIAWATDKNFRTPAAQSPGHTRHAGRNGGRCQGRGSSVERPNEKARGLRDAKMVYRPGAVAMPAAQQFQAQSPPAADVGHADACGNPAC
jgi:hypothetical protein